MKFLAKVKLSPHKYKTPEGYLICQDAILARTGKQQYLKSEVFPDNYDDGMIDINRPEDEVFSEKTLASFENKPITVEHPNENVTPENYKELAVGFTRDIRRGEFEGKPVMIGNLVITDPDVIKDIEEGFRTELSCGYDCDIIKDNNSNYLQSNIRGNHIALCECGRAGIAKIVDSKDNIKDMALSRADAMERCISLGRKFIEHFNKIYHNLDSTTVHHWLKEMQNWYDEVKSIKLKSTNDYILNGNLRDWFFTAGANPEDYMENANNDELKMYDKFVTELIYNKNLETAFKNTFNKLVTDVDPKENETKSQFISRFMKETSKEYPDRSQRYAVALSYWNKKSKKDSTQDVYIEDKFKGYDVPKGTYSDHFKTYLQDKGFYFETSENGIFIHFEVKNPDADVDKEVDAMRNYERRNPPIKDEEKFDISFYKKAIKSLNEKLNKLEKLKDIDENNKEYRKNIESMKETLRSQIKEYKNKILNGD